jgi:hypothetical protein
MSRILKIDNFAKDFPSVYGLDADGSCYEVKESFYLEVITGYESKGTISGVKYFEPTWSKIKCDKGDLISASKSGCYLQAKGTDGFMECRPISEAPEGNPKLENIPLNFVVKTGKDLMNVNSLSFAERNKITSSRLLL